MLFNVIISLLSVSGASCLILSSPITVTATRHQTLTVPFSRSIISSSSVQQQKYMTQDIKSCDLPTSFLSIYLSIVNAEDDIFQRKQPWDNTIMSLQLANDEVVGVLDSNTIKLKRYGLVTFGAIQTPSGYNKASFQYPECTTRSPSSKVRQILPSGTKVGIYFMDGRRGASNSQRQQRPQAALVVTRDTGKLVNAELVRSGFARLSISPRGIHVYNKAVPGLIENLDALQREAKEKGLGIYKKCGDTEMSSANDNQFEELQYSMQTRWSEDGGRPVLLKKEGKRAADEPPKNPGDTRGCSDFRFYEDALSYYEKYYPYYGDVARLDRDQDGIPCEGLPHTANPERYRVKKPR